VTGVGVGRGGEGGFADLFKKAYISKELRTLRYFTDTSFKKEENIFPEYLVKHY